MNSVMQHDGSLTLHGKPMKHIETRILLANGAYKINVNHPDYYSYSIRDKTGRLHCEDGPAYYILYRKQFAKYYNIPDSPCPREYIEYWYNQKKIEASSTEDFKKKILAMKMAEIIET